MDFFFPPFETSIFMADSERVRVAVRVRPRNAEELLPESDFVECVELQPEVSKFATKWKLKEKEEETNKKKRSILIVDQLNHVWFHY